MFDRVSKKKFNEFMGNRIENIRILEDIWNKSGSAVIRRIQDITTNKVIGIMINWEKYFILTHNL